MRLALVPAIALVAGCGSTDAGKQPAATATAAAVRDAATEDAGPPDPKAAVLVVRGELPQTGLWKGVRLRGRVVDAHTVCVDRVMSPSATAQLRSRISHVKVTWPDMETTTPRDGDCNGVIHGVQLPSRLAERAKAAARNDRETRAVNRWFMQSDTAALALEAAIRAVQDRGGTDSAIARLRDRLGQFGNTYYRVTGKASTGVNLLMSAATRARDAIAAGDPHELAVARSDVTDARLRLAEEALRGP